MKASLENVGEVLSKNSETELSSKVSLLDRELEIQDRFLGETRDHVIEVIREARDAAERDGRIRRAQLLESVLVANQPVGNLAKKRAEGKHYNVAISHAVKKLVRVIYHLERSNQQYIKAA